MQGMDEMAEQHGMQLSWRPAPANGFKWCIPVKFYLERNHSLSKIIHHVSFKCKTNIQLWSFWKDYWWNDVYSIWSAGEWGQGKHEVWEMVKKTAVQTWWWQRTYWNVSLKILASPILKYRYAIYLFVFFFARKHFSYTQFLVKFDTLCTLKKKTNLGCC